MSHATAERADLRSAGPALGAEPDHVCIGGERLPLSELFDLRQVGPAQRKSLQEDMRHAQPFAHLVCRDWFNPRLLELVHQEFDRFEHAHLVQVKTSHESISRTQLGAHWGPATQLYFGIVHSGWFVDLLSQVSGIDNLIPDVSLLGGGMHETHAGGAFDIHRDFDRHAFNGLRNELVLITYLNPGWQPHWHGALELWDAQQRACVRSIQPELGTTVLMRRTPTSFHGHPQPLAPPAGHSRRSVASYYYANPVALAGRTARSGTRFLAPNRSDRFRMVARALLPPLLWSAIRRATRR